MGPTTDLPTPVPIIDRLHVNGGGETACIDITGKNFTSKLKVSPRFGDIGTNFCFRSGSETVKLKRFADPRRT